MLLTEDCLTLLVDLTTGHYNRGTQSTSLWLTFLTSVQQSNIFVVESEVIASKFSVEAMVCGYHIYEAITVLPSSRNQRVIRILLEKCMSDSEGNLKTDFSHHWYDW